MQSNLLYTLSIGFFNKNYLMQLVVDPSKKNLFWSELGKVLICLSIFQQQDESRNILQMNSRHQVFLQNGMEIRMIIYDSRRPPPAQFSSFIVNNKKMIILLTAIICQINPRMMCFTFCPLIKVCGSMLTVVQPIFCNRKV